MSVELPSEEELAELPRWALVAYAVRCARRVQPFFDLPTDHPKRYEHLTAVDRAITLAAAGAGRVIDWPAIASAADDARSAARARGHGVASNSAMAASNAAYTAAAASVRAAAAAAITAHNSVMAVSDFYPLAVAAAATDFQHLKQFVVAGAQTVDTAESGPLGPLWPDGPPNWYPAAKARLDADLARIAAASGQSSAVETSAQAEPGAEPTTAEPLKPPDSRGVQLVVEIQIPENLSERQALDAIDAYVRQLDFEHRRLGGHGLKIAEIQAKELVPDEVPQYG